MMFLFVLIVLVLVDKVLFKSVDFSNELNKFNGWYNVSVINVFYGFSSRSIEDLINDPLGWVGVMPFLSSSCQAAV